ncbi:hypothetical protein AKO1_003565, partial [Acrasis kona]
RFRGLQVYAHRPILRSYTSAEFFVESAEQRGNIKRFFIIFFGTAIFSATFVYVRSWDMARRRRNQFAPSPFIYIHDEGMVTTTFFDTETIAFSGKKSTYKPEEIEEAKKHALTLSRPN